MEEQRNRGFRVKTINAVISKKFRELLDSVTDEKVKDLMMKNTIITGGCISSMLSGNRINDFDLYFTNKETVLAVANYYVAKFNEGRRSDYVPAVVMDGAVLFQNDAKDLAGMGGVGLNMTPDRVKIVIKSQGAARKDGGSPVNPNEEEAEDEAYVEPVTEEEPKPGETKPKYRPIYLTCNAITLSDQIQMVIRFYGDAAEIHKNYDFVHCTNYWTLTNGLVTNLPALHAIMAKELVYIGSKYPIASMIRTRKFIKRGWVINAGQYLKIAYQVSKLDMTDIKVLEDQLVGVDVAYFSWLIDELKKNYADEIALGKPIRLDFDYLANLVDTLF